MGARSDAQNTAGATTRSPLRASAPRLPLVIVVAGPSGAGKTSVGRALAASLNAAFLDADDLHSAEAKRTMASGTGLTDADRAPWLDRVRARIDVALASGDLLVVACSALKEAHRARLGVTRRGVSLVWLDVPADALQERLETRAGHFAGTDLLESQLRAAEPPAWGRFDGARPVGFLVSEIGAWLRTHPSGP